MNGEDADMNSAYSQAETRRDSARLDRAGNLDPMRVFALLWGVSGFVALLLFAIDRLLHLALDSLAYPWSPLHFAVFAANLLVMAWLEGYRGFQCRYSPRFAARARALLLQATPLQAALAPVVCMGFVHASRRRMIGAWALTLGIIGVVMVYRLLPQPWRGILDAGVVIGLAWGVAATLYHVARALRHGALVDAEMR